VQEFPISCLGFKPKIRRRKRRINLYTCSL
jgi:hypothetical protein